MREGGVGQERETSHCSKEPHLQLPPDLVAGVVALMEEPRRACWCSCFNGLRPYGFHLISEKERDNQIRIGMEIRWLCVSHGGGEKCKERIKCRHLKRLKI